MATAVALGPSVVALSNAARRLSVVRATVASTRDQASQIQDLAVRLARQAGEQIRSKSGRATQVDVKGVLYDLVTEVDKSIERTIQAEIRAQYPQHHCVGEETATRSELERLLNSADSLEWTWIVDPIDGTLNFVGGLPLSVVSIGVAFAGKLEVGVVYNPFHDELFVAQSGKGAYLNGLAISVLPPDTQLEDSVASVGFPSNPQLRTRMVEAISRVAPRVRSVRALGTAALHISYVAAGRLGCFFEHGLKPWDVAAARLILQEAGGKVSSMDGGPLSLLGGSVLASNGGLLHQHLVHLIADGTMCGAS